MRTELQVASARAISRPVQADSGKSITVQADSEDHSWFSIPARDLLGSDPGLALHVLTGISESSGYRYASGERGVPGYVIRQLLHGQQGGQWLAAIMHGCSAPWWSDLQKHQRMGSAAEAAR